MTARDDKRRFAARPVYPDRWIKAGDARGPGAADIAAHSARLTVDITPALRGRIKIAAFGRGVTVADMLRDLLAREFPPSEGDMP